MASLRKQVQGKGLSCNRLPGHGRAMPALYQSTKRGSILHKILTSRKEPLGLFSCEALGSTAPHRLRGMQVLSRQDGTLTFPAGSVLSSKTVTFASECHVPLLPTFCRSGCHPRACRDHAACSGSLEMPLRVR